MKRIKGNYDSELKEDLKAEVEARKLDVPNDATKPDLVAALEADDKGGHTGATGGTAAAAPGAGSLEKTAPANIPRPKNEQPLGGSTPTPPMDQFTDGTFTRKSDGEEYALAIVDANPLNGRTHRAMNTLHYWEGTEEQFRKAFTNKDGSGIPEAAKKKPKHE